MFRISSNLNPSNQKNVFGVGGEEFGIFLEQPTLSALLLILQRHLPYKCGIIEKKGNKQALKNKINYLEAHQTQNPLPFLCLYM